MSGHNAAMSEVPQKLLKEVFSDRVEVSDGCLDELCGSHLFIITGILRN